jgi:hypothetical protein
VRRRRFSAPASLKIGALQIREPLSCKVCREYVGIQLDRSVVRALAVPMHELDVITHRIRNCVALTADLHHLTVCLLQQLPLRLPEGKHLAGVRVPMVIC